MEIEQFKENYSQHDHLGDGVHYGINEHGIALYLCDGYKVYNIIHIDRYVERALLELLERRK